MTETNAKFVHLHVHTHYSLLDGMGKIPDYLDRAKELGMPALAITDHGVMYGAIEFYKEAKKRGINPIIGCECYIAPRKLTQKEGKTDTRPFHIVLLARNMVGYKNLLKLVTAAHLEGYYYKPRIDKEILRKHAEGLIGLSACLQGEVSRTAVHETYEKAKKAALEYEEIFGKDHFYLELQDQPGVTDQEKANEVMKRISGETGIGLVVTNDVHYVNFDDSEAQDILLCVQTGRTVEEEDRMRMDMDNSMRTYEDLQKAFPDVPQAFSNTVKIAEMCNVEIELGGVIIPDFPVPRGETLKSYLEKQVKVGVAKRYPEVSPELRTRIDYEMSVIEKMGYEGYFLIVQDYVVWAKNQGIVVGPGRGSAAGSVVAYALEIVDLDPIKFGLLFERFLNPDRISMPDIDMDFADDRRHEVIAYVTEKYGQDHVAQIITFGTMAARNAIRDVGRVLGISYQEVDKIAKAIPEKCDLRQALNESAEFRAFYTEDERYKKLIDLATKLEGVARHSSTHAAGVVFSRDPLVEYTPLQKATKGDLATNTQYEMHAIEDLGLLKMDFLGLSNLTVIKNAMRIIKKVYGDEIDLPNLPIDDKKTYQMLSKAETTGVFQLESAGMKRYIKDLKPNTFEDIVAMVALYRPGPMQFIDDFIARKHGKKQIHYDHPLMEDALKNTYGIIIYQEQVMQISKDLAGFTGGQADTLRKAMGKKIAELMKKMRQDFIDGAIKNNVKKEIAVKIFNDFEKFSQYGFVKAHAACYAMIAYWTAYLKAHYPAAFMAALMTSDYGNSDRIAIEISECQRMGIEVLPPDVNESFAEFGVVKETGKIRYGMMAIKNVGLGSIEAILAAREEGGKFTSIEDFAKRVPSSDVNKKVLESLIKCGAMESFGDRALLFANQERILLYSQKAQGNAANGQIDLFGGSGVEMPLLKLEPAPNMKTAEKLRFEKELLGIYISEHPMTEYKEQLVKLNVNLIVDLTEEMNNQTVKIGGVLANIQKVMTRTKQMMYFSWFEDHTGKTELIVFPKVIEEDPDLWNVGNVILVRGKVSTKDNQIKVIVEKAIKLEGNMGDADTQVVDPLITQSVKLEADGTINIFIPRGTSSEALNDIKYKLAANKGEASVFVYVPNGPSGPKKVKLPFGISYNEKLGDSIRRRLNEG